MIDVAEISLNYGFEVNDYKEAMLEICILRSRRYSNVQVKKSKEDILLRIAYYSFK
jgi:hypothetical protein